MAYNVFPHWWFDRDIDIALLFNTNDGDETSVPILPNCNVKHFKW